MQCDKQSYWHTEYMFHKNYTVDSPANNNYQRFAKRQYHRARRRHDKDIIDQELDRISHARSLWNDIFNTNLDTFTYI